MRKLLAALLALSIYLAAPCAAIKAESVQKADGTLRVWLQSLGAVKALGLTLDGAYTVEGDRGFRFEKGTEIKLGADGGSIVLEVGGAASLAEWNENNWEAAYRAANLEVNISVIAADAL